MEVTRQLKRCNKCLQDKTPSDFHFRNSAKTTRQTICKTCHRKRGCEYYQRNKQYFTRYGRDWYIFRTYGLKPEDFKSLLDSQSSLCAICRTDYPGKRGWHIDHDHATGEIRALLCAGCNLGLGGFRDNVASLESAIEYLKKFRNGRVPN